MSTVYDSLPPPVQIAPPDGVRVAIAIDDVSDHNLWADVTLDIACGGVFVATYHALPIGTEVDIELALAGAEAKAVRGVVRWTRAHSDASDGATGIGIQIVEPSTELLEQMQRFVETVRQPLVFECDERRSRPSVH